MTGPEIILRSTITCPECGARTSEEMPTDSCQWFWQCPHCGALLRPKEGDCCVFCSWGDVPCPSIQEVGNRESGEAADCC